MFVVALDDTDILHICCITLLRKYKKKTKIQGNGDPEEPVVDVEHFTASFPILQLY